MNTRKQDTRSKIELGGLVIKAGLSRVLKNPPPHARERSF